MREALWSGTVHGASTVSCLSHGRRQADVARWQAAIFFLVESLIILCFLFYRAIGDKKLKQWVIGTPDTAEFDLDSECDYLILGCDGLWDTMTRDKVRVEDAFLFYLRRLSFFFLSSHERAETLYIPTAIYRLSLLLATGGRKTPPLPAWHARSSSTALATC